MVCRVVRMSLAQFGLRVLRLESIYARRSLDPSSPYNTFGVNAFDSEVLLLYGVLIYVVLNLFVCLIILFLRFAEGE